LAKGAICNKYLKYINDIYISEETTIIFKCSSVWNSDYMQTSYKDLIQKIVKYQINGRDIKSTFYVNENNLTGKIKKNCKYSGMTFFQMKHFLEIFEH
jgi:hypothetical protein